MPIDGVIAKKIVASESPRGIRYDGASFIVWELSASPAVISRAASTNNVRSRLKWMSIKDSGLLDESINFVSLEPEMARVRPYLFRAVSDPGATYAFEDLSRVGSDILACTLWICSPNEHVLLFISLKH